MLSIRSEEDKFDTVHENETGYSLALASVAGSNHHVTETGFCFCYRPQEPGADGIQEDETG
ncbi:hypothetical protein CHU32_21230 [Superficieibacter electus]|uniref:Uncharacterized protein n=1 Tax=Superficieibacter electus TaxID=2022662 RepID=A0A2P5GK18_9ENTR|nr:hypothetical protein CHU33_20345 [Superficieibacter electus]POP44478.1 hypothetical protein CHU32_21230 [Superficieibacter electus]